MAVGSRFIGNDSKFKSTTTRRLGITFLSSSVNKIEWRDSQFLKALP